MLCHSRKCIIVYSENVAYNLETDNPYVPSDVFADGTSPLLNSRIDMPQDILEKARKFEKLRCPIRFITMLDIFISLYYFYVSWLFGILFTTASIGGFMATIYYKKSLMTCYVGYQYFQVAGRAANLGYFIYLISYTPNPLDKTANNTNQTQLIHLNGSVVNNNYAWEIVILSMMLMAQCYIAHNVSQFYKLLPCDMDRDRVLYQPWF